MENPNEKIKRWLDCGRANPNVAEFHLTNKCNLRCLPCWQRNTSIDLESELSDKKWVSITEQATRLGVKECYIGGGGEPMCRKNLTLQVMKRIKEQDIKGAMTTNCTLFNEEDIKELINIGWDHLQVSIDGPDKTTQDLLRGQGVYDKNVQILKLFNKWKKKLKKEKPNISFHTVLSNKNYDKLCQLILFADKVGVKELNLQPLVVQSELCKSLTLNLQQEVELRKELKIASDLAKKRGMITNFEKLLKGEETKKPDDRAIKCFEPWDRITILSDGKVKTCCNPNKTYESVHKKLLEKIWYGKKFDKIRKRFYKGLLMEECCTHPNKRI